MYCIGIDLGGTKVSVGLVDEKGVIVAKGTIPTKAERHYKEIIKDMAILTRKVLQDSGL